MRDLYVVIDSNGKALDAGTFGHGFRLTPGRTPAMGEQARPGSYPITVKPDGGNPLTITCDSSRMLKPFNSLTLLDGQPGDVWKLEILESPTERVEPAGVRSTVPVSLQPPTAIDTVTPPVGGVGFKVRPGTRAHTFYASGVIADAELWVRSARGNWYLSETLLFTVNPVQARSVWNSGDRIYLRAAAATLLIEIDAEIEVG